MFAAPITNPFGLTNVGVGGSGRGAAAFADIDRDGDLDAFVGNYDGNTLFYRNTGTASSAAFAAPITNPFGLTDVGNAANPTFADIDGDGYLDAFVSGNAYSDILFYESIASVVIEQTEGITLVSESGVTVADPIFSSPTTNPFGLTGLSLYQMEGAFADIDGDGDLDAFAGNSAGDTLFFQNDGTVNSALSAAPIPMPLA